MLKNYFTVALRNLSRNKTFTAINIAGLATGIAVFILIFEFVAAEWSSNRFHANFKQLYRVGSSGKAGDNDFYLAPGFAPLMQQQVPAIKAIVRVTEDLGNGVISYTDEKTGQLKVLREENIAFADSNFFQAFSFPLVAGKPSLAAPNTMAMAASTAIKIFGSTRVSGKVITLSNQFGNSSFRIAAVFQDPLEQSDIRPGILLSLNTLQSATGRNGNDWADPNTLDNSFTNCYIVLQKGSNAKAISRQLTRIVHAAQPAAADRTVVLQPFNELHLAPSFSYPYQTFGSLKLVAMLLAVAVLVLLIAWINYINLSTVQAMKRAKETGVRKVLGASRGQLTVQYLTETLLITLLSVGLSFLIVQLLQGLFNSFTGKELSLGVLNHGWFWWALLAGILFGSLLSGGYVAFVLSSFRPVVAIRGKVTANGKGISLRKCLVVFQFTISIVFIISTIILYRQLQYMKHTDLG
ncbi:MAG TPA: ABC transporter permease, partial [Chitinophagaceae bacterium]|nr:ABC transporter permease [Chitinophagaceae bacterium]